MHVRTNAGTVKKLYVVVVDRRGKNWQNGKLLAGKFCDLEEKNKEIHKGNHPTLEGNLPCWREILPSLQGNKHFFLAWTGGGIINCVYIHLDTK